MESTDKRSLSPDLTGQGETVVPPLKQMASDRLSTDRCISKSTCVADTYIRHVQPGQSEKPVKRLTPTRLTADGISSKSYPRQFWESNEKKLPAKELNFYFTPTVSKIGEPLETRPEYVENSPEWWTKGDVKPVGNALLIKRLIVGNNDSILIRREPHIFKLPTKALELLTASMEKCLESLSKDENGEYVFEGITEPTLYENLASNEFWDSPNCIRIYWFRVIPYIAEFRNGQKKLCFRMMNEVAEKNKIYKAGKLVWSGPSASINPDTFQGMLEVFQDIKRNLQTGSN